MAPSSAPSAGTPRSGSARRRAVLAALLAAALCVLLTYCTTTAGPSTKQPAEAKTSPHLVKIGQPSSHARAWAILVHTGQMFAADAETAHGKHGTYALGKTPAAVAKKIRFTVPIVTVADYHGTTNGYRYCLTSRTGEFYAADLTSGTQTTVMGLGRCNYDRGVVYTHGKQVLGRDVLSMVKVHYDDLAETGLDLSAPIVEAFDGKNAALPEVVLATGFAISGYAKQHGQQPATLSPKTLAGLGLTYTAPIRVGYYDNRADKGYRLCLTDGTEEAILQSTPAGETLLRHSTGTCHAQ